MNETQTMTLRAAVDRIIPPDDLNPGGAEAGAYDYLLRQLAPGGDLVTRNAEYETGLDALDALARRTHAAPFATLSPDAQDTVLIAFEQQAPAFFRAFVEHAQEGFYTSPVAWEMIGWRVSDYAVVPRELTEAQQ